MRKKRDGEKRRLLTRKLTKRKRKQRQEKKKRSEKKSIVLCFHVSCFVFGDSYEEEEGSYPQCQAIGDWAAANEGDLGLSLGDVVDVWDKDSDPTGWWQGANTATGAQGYFPRFDCFVWLVFVSFMVCFSNYVKLI
jgi:hypothetical protein